MPDPKMYWEFPGEVSSFASLLGRRCTRFNRLYPNVKLMQFRALDERDREVLFKENKEIQNYFFRYWDQVIKSYVLITIPYRGFEDEDVWMARDYVDACRKLDREYGEKARELLFSFLNEGQIDSYYKKQYFDQVLEGPYFVNEGQVKIRHLAYDPNGFKLLVKDQEVLICCMHPEEPYPTADNILGRYLLFKEDPMSIFTVANPPRPLPQRVHVERR